MAIQLRLLENQTENNANSPDRSARPLPMGVERRGSGHRAPRAPIREPLDSRTRQRGLQGVAAARKALRDANQRVAIRDAERRRLKQAELVELAGRARVIASSSDDRSPTTPRVPDGNAAA